MHLTAKTKGNASEQNAEAAKDRFHLHNDPGWSTCFAKLGASSLRCQLTFQTAFGAFCLEGNVVARQHA